MEDSRSSMIEEKNGYIGDDDSNSENRSLQQNLQPEAGWSEDEFDIVYDDFDNDQRHREETDTENSSEVVVGSDERAIAEWRRLHPGDVEYEENFWAQKKAAVIPAKEARRAAREDKRRRKAFADEHHRRLEANLPTIPSDDERWADVFESTEEDTESYSDLSDWD
ncbi:hypothetical protein ACQ4PT_045854 [Festuca glaucescens]